MSQYDAESVVMITIIIFEINLLYREVKRKLKQYDTTTTANIYKQDNPRYQNCTRTFI